MATAQHDLLIRNARLRGQGDKLSDIAISNGRITAIGGGIAGSAVDTVNAEGNLVTESFVNTHLHLCKVWSLEKMDELAMGAYHGDKGFETFSHMKPVFYQSRFSSGAMLHPPYTEKTSKLLNLIRKIA